MTTQKAPCGLCRNRKELRESHLLPAACYKLSRTADGRSDPNPVIVTRGRTLTTSRQVSSAFLCDDCEQLFSRHGEKYVLTQCAQPDGQFKLRGLIQSSPPIFTGSEYQVYDVQPLLGTKVDQYLYFAASVFWRASAHRWKLGNEEVGRISLGAEYQEQFRQYLLGEAAFPKNGRTYVYVSAEDQPDLTTVFPCSYRLDGGVHRHKFYIPGILFILFLGKDVLKRFDDTALNGSQRQLMWVCPWQDDSLFSGSLDLIKSSIPVGKLCR